MGPVKATIQLDFLSANNNAAENIYFLKIS